jgi:hypothetical protein
MKKNKLFILLFVIVVTAAACAKESITNNDLGVDIKKYETTLNTDYKDALKNHNALTSNPALYKALYNADDSLFSEHFYVFCIDMMNNSGMMNSTNGMMGNNGSMMGGSGGMMNGVAMGGQSDMNQMMNYMDSIHLSNVTIMVHNYMKTDSLMYNQMNMCKMMTAETEYIGSIFVNMQTLRKNHKKLHGI